MNFLLQTLHRLAIARAGGGEVPSPEADAQAVPSSPPQPTESYPPLPPAVDPGALERVHGRTVGRGVRAVFSIWVIVFGLIGAQMGWVLRPFIGAPNAPVTFFRSREGNFFQAVVDKIGDLASEPQSPRTTPPGGPAPREWRR